MKYDFKNFKTEFWEDFRVALEELSKYLSNFPHLPEIIKLGTSLFGKFLKWTPEKSFWNTKRAFRWDS